MLGWGRGWVGAELEPELSAHTRTHSHTAANCSCPRLPSPPLPSPALPSPPRGLAAETPALPPLSLSIRPPSPHHWPTEVTLTHKKSSPEKKEKQARSLAWDC